MCISIDKFLICIYYVTSFICVYNTMHVIHSIRSNLRNFDSLTGFEPKLLVASAIENHQSQVQVKEKLSCAP